MKTDLSTQHARQVGFGMDPRRARTALQKALEHEFNGKELSEGAIRTLVELKEELGHHHWKTTGGSWEENGRKADGDINRWKEHLKGGIAPGFRHFIPDFRRIEEEIGDKVGNYYAAHQPRGQEHDDTLISAAFQVFPTPHEADGIFPKGNRVAAHNRILSQMGILHTGGHIDNSPSPPPETRDDYNQIWKGLIRLTDIVRRDASNPKRQEAELINRILVNRAWQSGKEGTLNLEA